MEKYIEQNGITYELRGEQYYPLLELPEQKEGVNILKLVDISTSLWYTIKVVISTF